MVFIDDYKRILKKTVRSPYGIQKIRRRLFRHALTRWFTAVLDNAMDCSPNGPLDRVLFTTQLSSAQVFITVKAGIDVSGISFICYRELINNV